MKICQCKTMNKDKRNIETSNEHTKLIDLFPQIDSFSKGGIGNRAQMLIRRWWHRKHCRHIRIIVSFPITCADWGDSRTQFRHCTVILIVKNSSMIWSARTLRYFTLKLKCWSLILLIVLEVRFPITQIWRQKKILTFMEFFSVGDLVWKCENIPFNFKGLRTS